MHNVKDVKGSGGCIPASSSDPYSSILAMNLVKKVNNQIENAANQVVQLGQQMYEKFSNHQLKVFAQNSSAPNVQESLNSYPVSHEASEINKLLASQYKMNHALNAAYVDLDKCSDALHSHACWNDINSYKLKVDADQAAFNNLIHSSSPEYKKLTAILAINNFYFDQLHWLSMLKKSKECLEAQNFIRSGVKQNIMQTSQDFGDVLIKYTSQLLAMHSQINALDSQNADVDNPVLQGYAHLLKLTQLLVQYNQGINEILIKASIEDRTRQLCNFEKQVTLENCSNDQSLQCLYQILDQLIEENQADLKYVNQNCFFSEDLKKEKLILDSSVKAFQDYIFDLMKYQIKNNQPLLQYAIGCNVNYITQQLQHSNQETNIDRKLDIYLVTHDITICLKDKLANNLQSNLQYDAMLNALNSIGFILKNFEEFVIQQCLQSTPSEHDENNSKALTKLEYVAIKGIKNRLAEWRIEVQYLMQQKDDDQLQAMIKELAEYDKTLISPNYHIKSQCSDEYEQLLDQCVYYAMNPV